LIATISTGDLPHGIWHSGNNERVYVRLENSDAVLAIDKLNNKVICDHPNRSDSRGSDRSTVGAALSGCDRHRQRSTSVATADTVTRRLAQLKKSDE
jgi:hypothetical protein